MKSVRSQAGGPSPRSVAGVILLLILLGGGSVRLPHLTYGLPAGIDPDVGYTVGAAQNLARDWKQGKPSLDPGAYFYPTLYTNVLASILYFKESAGSPIAVARALNVAGDLGMALLIFLLIFQWTNSSLNALLGASLVSFGFIFVRMSFFTSPDSFQALFFSASLFFLYRVRKPSLSDISLSGLMMGLATGTKYTAFLYLFILFFSSYWFEAHAVRRYIKEGGVWLLCGLAGFLLSTPSVFVAGSQYVQFLGTQKLIQQGSIGQSNWNFLSYLSLDEVLKDGPFISSITGMLGLPFTILSVLSFSLLFFEGLRKREGRYFGLAVSGFLSYAYFAVGTHVYGLRYLLPWVVLAACAISVSVQEASSYFSKIKKPALALPIGVAVIFSLLLGPSLSRQLTYISALQFPDSRFLAANWILGHVKAHEKILAMMFGPALPANRYRTVQWIFPEYRFELQTRNYSPPRFEDLKEQGIQRVVWNSFYGDRFNGPSMSERESDYMSGWKKFHEDLLKYSGQVVVFSHPLKLTPDVEIFSLESRGT